MIIIGNNVWRTLQQPIYIDGKHVEEVYANGVKVYPEAITGNFIKFAGEIDLNYVHTHSGIYMHDTGFKQAMTVEQWRYRSFSHRERVVAVGHGNFDFHMRIKAKFVATLRELYSGNQFSYINTDEYIGQKPGTERDNWPSVLIENNRHVIHSTNFDITSYAVPYYGAINRNSYKIKTVPQNNDFSLIESVKLKFEMDQIPLCMPVLLDVEDDQGELQRFSYMSDRKSITYTAYNDRIFEWTDTKSFSYPKSRHDLGGSTDGGGMLYFQELMKNTPGVAGFELHGAALRVDVAGGQEWIETDSQGNTRARRDDGGYGNTTISLAYIPITNILYIGDYDTTPEEIITIDDSEVDF